uniref:Putative elongation factor 1-alpha n=2 Tax=Anopheles marajoara TaxID=58244 RepID=A0A2M4BI76_9DIPT
MEMDQLQTQIQTESPFCRLCFSQASELYELFPNAGHDNESLLIKILEVVPIAISFEEDLNSYICGKCVTLVEEFYEYREKVKENDALLREKRKSVDHTTTTAIYNVVSMQPDGTHSSTSPNGAANGQAELGGGGVPGGDGVGGTVLDETQVALDHRIAIDGNAPLNGNILEFKKQLFTASPSQVGVWLCVASGSDIHCPAAIEVDDNIQVVAEIGQHNHGLPVSVAENPPEPPKLPQQQQQQHLQQQQQQQQQQPQSSVDTTTCVVVTNASGSPGGTLVSCPATVVESPGSVSGTSRTPASTKSSSSRKKKSRDQPSKRKVSNDILVGDGWLIDVNTFKRNHYQLVTKDGYQTFLIYNGYRFRTQQKIRNGIAAWKCAWNGRKGCQAILHISEDYQKVKEAGSPHNHDPSLRDRIISNKPANGGSGSDQSLMLQSDGEGELGQELRQTITSSRAAVLGHPGTSSSSTSLAGEVVTLSGTQTTATATTSGTTLELSSDIDFVQQSSSSGSELITTTTTTTSADHQQPTTTQQHHHHQQQQHGHHHHSHHVQHQHHTVVGVVDEVVGKDDSTISMDIEEIIRPHVVLHSGNE